MAPVERSDVAAASAATIWKTCFADMKWEEWDEDVVELVDVKGGCTEGGTFTFHIKNGDRMAPCKLSNVKENESLVFTGTLFGGAMGFEGRILLTPLEGDDKTKVDYSFGVSKLLGGLIMLVNSNPIVHGTETGLANIIRLSEEAEKQK